MSLTAVNALTSYYWGLLDLDYHGNRSRTVCIYKQKWIEDVQLKSHLKTKTIKCIKRNIIFVAKRNWKTITRLWYEGGSGFVPPAYPTLVRMTPLAAPKRASGNQNQLIPKVAFCVATCGSNKAMAGVPRSRTLNQGKKKKFYDLLIFYTALRLLFRY